MENRFLVDAQELATKANENELFCPEQCAFRAEEYWEAAREVKLDAARELSSKLRTFAIGFFRLSL